MKLKNQQTKRLGKAAVEAAVVLALVVGCLVWAVSQLGQTISDSYSHVFDSSEQVAASDAERSDSVSNASQPLLTSTTGYRTYLPYLAVSAVCIVSIFLLFRRRPQEARTTQEISDEIKEKVLRKEFQMPTSLLSKREFMVDRFLAALVNENGVSVKDIMSGSPLVIQPYTPFERLQRIMKQAGIRHLLIGDPEQRTVKGIVSDRDLNKPDCKTAADAMTTELLTVSPADEIHTAISTMLGNRVSSLPVVDGEKLVGIVSLSDLAIALQCTMIVLRDFFVSSAPFCKVPTAETEEPSPESLAV